MHSGSRRKWEIPKCKEFLNFSLTVRALIPHKAARIAIPMHFKMTQAVSGCPKIAFTQLRLSWYSKTLSHLPLIAVARMLLPHSTREAKAIAGGSERRLFLTFLCAL
jgi:hypothetical protein